MSAIFLIGAAFASFFVLLLQSKKTKLLSDRLLSAWFIVFVVHLLLYYSIYEKLYLDYPHLLGLPNTIPFLYGPLFFFYVDTLASENPRFRGSYYLHFMPFLLANLEHMNFYLADEAEKIAMYSRSESYLAPWTRTVIIVAKLASGPTYLTIVWTRLLRHSNNVRQYFSCLAEVELRWLKTIVAIYTFFLAMVFLLLMLDQTVFGDSDPIIFAAVAGFVIALGYGGFRQGMIFGEHRATVIPPVEEVGKKEKYVKSNLSEEEARRSADLLLEWMESHKPYLNPDLTIESAASTLNIPRHKLTQTINQQLGMNFYQFVNDFRIREFKQRILDPSNRSLTMLAVAMECGFNSKSTFNTVFKNLTNMTPSEFRKAQSVGTAD